MTLLHRYHEIKKSIEDLSHSLHGNSHRVRFVAVSKGQPVEKIIPLIEAGHVWFGENRYQEAAEKWLHLKKIYPHVKLQFIGPLQSNKALDVMTLCDSIISIDRTSLVDALLKSPHDNREFLIQINSANESQKSGVALENLEELLSYCHRGSLLIQGTMILPPNDCDPDPFFHQAATLAQHYGMKELSMGMSHDYKNAIAAGSTQVRIGSLLFSGD